MPVFQMWDNRAFINMAALIGYAASFNYYLYQLFYGSWETIQTKSFYYSFTILLFLWLIIDEMKGYTSYFNQAFNFACKFCIVINFIIITLTLNNKLSTPIAYFKIFDCSILVLTLMILISGCRHGYFKKNND